MSGDASAECVKFSDGEAVGLRWRVTLPRGFGATFQLGQIALGFGRFGEALLAVERHHGANRSCPVMNFSPVKQINIKDR